jgi:hypothetical protein
LAALAAPLVGACALGADAPFDAGIGAADAAANDGTAPDVTGRRPDATPGPDGPLPDACTPQWIELLSNGDFDLGNTGWTAVAGPHEVIREWGDGYPWPAHSGTWAAILLGFNDGAQSLSQVVSVPADATVLRFAGHRCFVTEETSTTTAYDTLAIELRDGAVVVDTLFDLSNLDAGTSCDWELAEASAAGALAGKEITLHFDAQSDLASVTSFGWDTLSLQALACP